MTVKRGPAYYKSEATGDKQVVVLYDDGTTVVWNSDGAKGTNSGGDNFDPYCRNLEHSGYEVDDDPGWAAPSEP